MDRKDEKGIKEHIFIDHLGVGGLSWFVLSWLLGARHSGGFPELFVIDGVSRGARILATLLRVCAIRIKMHELDFDFMDDVRLPDGTSGRNEIAFNAAPVLLRRIEWDPQCVSAIHRLARAESHEHYIRVYFSKRTFIEIYRELQSVLVAAWYSRTRLDSRHPKNVLYLKASWFFDFLSEYAVGWDIQLRPLPSGAVPWGSPTQRLRPLLGRVYRWARSVRSERAQLDGDGPPLRIAAEIYLHGISQQPIYNTDLFWYRGSKLPPGAVFAYFEPPQDQPTKPRQVLLKDAGIAWIDRTRLRRLMYAPRRWDDQSWMESPRSARAHWPGETKIQKTLRGYIEDFYSEYDRWRRFFGATGARVHVSTFDVFPHSEALHAALSDVGGISVSIQRSIEREPYIFRRTVTDVHFALARAQAEWERLSGSCVHQFIVCGYPFDDAFPAAMAHARQLVSRLRTLGVTFTLCFFDQNEGDHRKRLGGAHTQSDYGFLCDKLAADETLGLILKPKRPESLPARLGPVWPRVQRLIDSGRCIFLGGRSLDERYLPCVGACVADLAISILGGATAGLESYLAGTKTLLIRQDQDLGAFKRLPEGSVVFDTLEDLWQTVERFRANPSDPHIGNWEPIIEEFTSLRDGRASDRIGGYITWLYEALASGKSREQAMEHAGNLYAAAWGADLITEIVQPLLAQSVKTETRSTHEVEVDCARPW